MSIFRYLKKVYDYARVLIDDYDFDHIYILRILQYKIQRTRKCIDKYGHSVNKDRDCQRMRYVENLLQRMIDDEYEENVFEEFYKKWGRPSFEFESSGKGYSKLNINYPNVTEETQEIHDKEFKWRMEKAEQLRKQDYELCFKMLEKHIRTWWD